MPYVAMILAAILVAVLLRQRSTASAKAAAPAVPPAAPAASGSESAEPPDRGMTDPVLRRLYLLLYEITQVSPEVTRPEHLVALPGYREAVELLSDPAVKSQLLFD